SDKPKLSSRSLATIRADLTSPHFFSSNAMFCCVKFDTLKRMSGASIKVSPLLRTTSLLKLNGVEPLLRVDSSERVSSRASSSCHWFVAIERSRSEYDRVVP